MGNLTGRIEKLETHARTRRKLSEKPLKGTDWTAAELIIMANTWPDYPPDLAEKFAQTNWGDNTNFESMSEEELTEAIITKANFLAEDGVDAERLILLLTH